MKIKINELSSLVYRSLSKKYSSHYSSLLTEIVMYGELSGRSTHGLTRLLLGGNLLNANPTSDIEIITKTKLSKQIIGHGNPGMLLGQVAADEVIEIAKNNLFGLVGTKESFTSSGCLSYYLEKITSHNLIGIIMAQSPLSTPPFGGIQPMFGTNPIAFGIPSVPRPLIFDMGTTAITYGQLLKADALGEKLPPNTCLDKNGNPTTDPKEALDGMTLSFDNSYKGSGLGMMVEILSGMWPGADNAGLDQKSGWGNLFLAFSPELLMDVDTFKHKAEIFVNTIRNSKTKDGSKVRIPGEKTQETYQKNIKIGEIDIDDKIYNLLMAAQ